MDENALENVRLLLGEKNLGGLKRLLNALRPEDAADVIAEMEDGTQQLVALRLLSPEKAEDVFEDLPLRHQEKLLRKMSSEELKQIITEMPPDERTQLFEDLPARLVQRLLQLLSPEDRREATRLLNYPEDSVGRFLTPDFIKLGAGQTAREAVEHIRRAGVDRKTIYNCYVLDDAGRLAGIVSLKNLILAPEDETVGNIMFTGVIRVKATTDKEDAARIFTDYDLVVLPVVDDGNRLLGIVTFDDMVDVLEEEVTEDFEKIAAVVPLEKPYWDIGFAQLLWKRGVWLIALLFLQSLSSIVLESYSDMIAAFVSLSFFIPLLIGAGGNAGTQSATFVIRGIATGEFQTRDFFKIVFREASVGVLLGIVIGLAGVVRVMLQGSDKLLSLVVGSSLCVAVLLATTVGAVLPLLVKRFRMDPAMMSMPLITTIVDISGVAIYFSVAKLIFMWR